MTTNGRSPRDKHRPIFRRHGGANEEVRLPEEISAAQRSRRLLVEVAKKLEEFGDAITVVGAHAVFARVELSITNIQMPSTADADLAINPALVASDPQIIPLLGELGLVPASVDRPGIYGYAGEEEVPQKDRTTIDLIAPELYAGKGRRAARIAGQERAVSRAVGLEVAMFDRDVLTVSTLPGDEPQASAEVFVAGVAALLVAKVHKLNDRLNERDRRPDRLRPKDSEDVGLLMLASDPETVAETLCRVSVDQPDLVEMISFTSEFLVREYRYGRTDGILRATLTRQLGEPATSKLALVDSWLETFESTF